MLNKFMFWKKDTSAKKDLTGLPPISDEPVSPALGMHPDVTKESGIGLDLGPEFREPAGPSPSSPPGGYGPAMSQGSTAMQQPPLRDKDLEVISAKLDAVNASLESINHRLAALEHIARQSNEPKW